MFFVCSTLHKTKSKKVPLLLESFGMLSISNKRRVEGWGSYCTGRGKGVKEFDQLITEESKLKKSHSAISFILKLCKVSSLFIFSSFPIGSSVMRWALLGGLCSTGGSRGGGLGGCVLVGWGVGARGWRRHPPPQTPATPPSPCEVPPNRSSANSSPPLAICHQQKCCSDASKTTAGYCGCRHF